MPLPASVEVDELNAVRRDILETDKETVFIVELHDTADSPHATTTPEGFESEKSLAEHFTNALTVNGDEPLGRLDNDGVETKDPEVSAKEDDGKELEFEKKDRPLLFCSHNPSIDVPDR